MSILTELSRLQTAKANMKTALESKEVVVPSNARLSDYPALITSIGAKAVEEKFLNFYDFEGTLVASYDADEIAGLTELPEAPDHSADEVPLTFEEWNWTLAEIKEYHTAMPEGNIDVGANYHTTDGKTHAIYYQAPGGEYWQIGIHVYANGTVDWGDGTVDSFSAGDDITHVYTGPGRFHCIIDHEADESVQFGGELTDANPTTLNWSLTELYLPVIKTFSGAKMASAMSKCSIPSSVESFVSEGFLMSATDFFTLPRALVTLSTSDYFETAFSSILARKISIPPTLAYIGRGSFSGNMRIQEYTLPLTTEVISNAVFSYSDGIIRAIIPPRVTEIQQYAFQDCYRLHTVILKGTTPPVLDSEAFSSPPERIIVPRGTLTAYQSATNWSDYADIMEESTE